MASVSTTKKMVIELDQDDILPFKLMIKQLKHQADTMDLNGELQNNRLKQLVLDLHDELFEEEAING